MIELYHHGSSVCAAKVRFALAEKAIEPDKYHYIDIFKGEQFNKEYLSINPKAVVPALVHNGNIFTESTIICEYIDDAFPGPPLKPDDPYALAKMRQWAKMVDDEIHFACRDLTFVCCHRHILLRLGKAGNKKPEVSTPKQSSLDKWPERRREIIELGFDAPGIDQMIRFLDTLLFKAEEALKDHMWLAGDSFSLADIALTPYINRLNMLCMANMWEDDRLPYVSKWFGRIQSRLTFKRALLDWCPEDLTRDLKTFGAQSWPQVGSTIGIGLPCQA